MADFSQLFMAFVRPFVLILALAMVFNMAKRKLYDGIKSDLLAGLIFAAAVLYSMSDPIPIPTGGIVDMRGMLIGCAAALLGPKVGLYALAAGLAMRGYVGGTGMYAGFVGMGLSFAGGWAWRIWIAPRNIIEWQKTLILGGMISSQSFAIFVVPMENWGILFQTLAPYTTLCNVVGTAILNHLFEHEEVYTSRLLRLEQEAATDHLTGLSNRRSLEARFPDLTKDTTTGLGMTALYFDIDHFKLINDTYGHAIGDKILQILTDRLSTAFRARDIFCRLGGDEFVVLLPNLSQDESARIAERCRMLVADQPFFLEGLEIHATISIGAIWTGRTLTFDALLHAADQALYEAKAMGRNTVAFKTKASLMPPNSFSTAA